MPFLFGKPNVNKLKTKGDVRGLIKALGYEKNSDIRCAAAKALGELGDKQATEPLIAVLRDTEPGVRRTAAEALGKLGGTQAAESLITALQNSDSEIRKAATKALVNIGTPALEPLIATLRDTSDQNLRQTAADVLVEIGAPAVEPLIAVLKDEKWHVGVAAAGALGEIGDTRAVDPLIAALESKAMTRRYAAAKALGKLGDKRATKPLIAVLRDTQTSVRVAAVEALGHIADVQAVEPLTLINYKDGLTEMREAAARALEQIGDSAVPPLVVALKGKGKERRGAAANMLDRLGWKPDSFETRVYYLIAKQQWDRIRIKDPAAVPPLIAVLRKQDTSTRRRAAETLGKTCDERAVDPLITALRDKYSAVRESAARALGLLGDSRAVEPLIAVLQDTKPDVRQAAIEALEQFEDARTVEPLIAALNDEDVAVSAAVARVLGRSRDARAVDPLIAALEAEDQSMREAAAKALKNLDWQPPDEDEINVTYWITMGEWDKCIELGSQAVPALIVALKAENQPTRKAAAKTLEKIGTPAVEPLSATLHDKDTRMRQRVVKVLGEIGDALAVDPLIIALQDEKKAVRLAAVKALAEVGSKLQDTALRTRVVESLIDVLKGQDEGMGKIAAKAIEPLIAFLDDRDIHLTAREALQTYRSEAQRRSVEREARRRSAERELRRRTGLFNEPEFEMDPIAMLNEAMRGVYYPTQDLVNAVRCLGQTRDPRAVEILKKALRDQDFEVREAAAWALRQMGIS